MSMSNIEYSALKKKKGLHNWGFSPSRLELENEIETLESLDLSEGESPELIHENAFGEYYALQDYEE